MPDITPTDTMFPGELGANYYRPNLSTFDEFSQTMQTMVAIEDGHQFWIGDLLVAARNTLGEDWAQLIPEGKAETYRGYMWTADKVPPHVRRQLGGYSQAKLIAKLSVEEQEAVCKEHEPASLTKRELQEKLRNTSGKAEENPGNTQGISEPWTKPQLTWGQLKALIDDDELIEDDTPICLNVGPEAVDISVEMQPEDDYQSRYVEGRAGDRAAAVCGKQS